jgi:molecular chaperone HtpG
MVLASPAQPGDHASRDRTARLPRITSTTSADTGQDAPLSGYAARMKEGQEKICYLLPPLPSRP